MQQAMAVARPSLSLTSLALDYPELFAEGVATQLTPAELLRKLAPCATPFDHVARSEGLWRRHFEERSWRVAPMAVPGSVLARRWEEVVAVEDHSVARLKEELRVRSIASAGLFEKGELRDAVRRACGRDLESLGVPTADGPCARGRPGVWRALYLGCVRAEVLRRTRVLDRPFRAMVQRHFIGPNAVWDSEWRERWVEVEDDVLSVYESERSSRPLAQVSLRDLPAAVLCVPLPPALVPNERDHCFSVTNLGVEVALYAGCAEVRWRRALNVDVRMPFGEHACACPWRRRRPPASPGVACGQGSAGGQKFLSAGMYSCAHARPRGYITRRKHGEWQGVCSCTCARIRCREYTASPDYVSLSTPRDNFSLNGTRQFLSKRYATSNKGKIPDSPDNGKI
jgi:hypothetical protein